MTRLSLRPALLTTLLVVSWFPTTGPWQLIGYGLPIAIFVLASAIGLIRISLKGGAFVVSLVALSLLSGLLAPNDFFPLNIAVALLTYGSILLLWLDLGPARRTYPLFLTWIAWLSIVQLGFGIVQLVEAAGSLQFARMSDGDAVVGTLLSRTNSHLFSVKMLFHTLVLAIGYLHGFRSRLVVVGLLSAIFGAILASALFSTALFFGSLMAALFLVPLHTVAGIPKRLLRRLRGTTLAIVLAVVAVFATFQQGNVRYFARVTASLPGQIGQSESSYGKVTGTLHSLDSLIDDPRVFTIGTGLGHYSSRAALILSGAYLSDHPSYIPISASSHTISSIVPLWNPSVWSVRFRDGVLNQPFYSLQSLLLEVGIVGSFVIAVGVLILVRRSLRHHRSDDRTSVALRTTALFTLSVLPAVLLSENWLEYPAFMIPVWLLLSLLSSDTLREGPNRGEGES